MQINEVKTKQPHVSRSKRDYKNKDKKTKRMIKRVLSKTTLGVNNLKKKKDLMAIVKKNPGRGLCSAHHQQASVRDDCSHPGLPETSPGLWTSHTTPLPGFPSTVWKDQEIYFCEMSREHGRKISRKERLQLNP